MSHDEYDGQPIRLLIDSATSTKPATRKAPSQLIMARLSAA